VRSSRIHVFDTKPDPKRPRLAHVIQPEELAERAGYSRPHTVHCGPEGIYVSALGNGAGKGPGGVFLVDPESFAVLGRWELDRGPQYFAYDFWWHLGHDTMVTSEWGTPDMVENGLVPELILGAKYGRRLHFFDLHKRRHVQEIDFGDKYQLVFELRPAHDPTKAYGFVNCVLSLEDLSSSIWLWHRANGRWAVEKVITIPAEPADPAKLPPVLQPFGAVPPLVTDIDLSVDDRFLYVSCWGTGQFLQYDVSDPRNPKLTGELRIGGIVSRAAHPSAPDRPLNGGPQMVAPEPRRKADLLHQFALRSGRPAVLPRRDRGLDGQGRGRPGGRHALRSALLPALARPAPAAPDPPRGRRRLLGLLLLPVVSRRLVGAGSGRAAADPRA
jgi:56kDa selenium binding protein (SBP56).